jgi:hypothetical protein
MTPPDDIRRWFLTHGWEPYPVEDGWLWTNPDHPEEFQVLASDHAQPMINLEMSDFHTAWVATAQHCKHEQFESDVKVARVGEVEGSPGDPAHFVAEVKVRCTECRENFGFRGVQGGFNFRQPTVNVTAKQINLPMMSPSEMDLQGGLAGLQNTPSYEIEGYPATRSDA